MKEPMNPRSNEIPRKIARLVCGLFFAVTCFIGFVALMFVNLSITEKLFPGVANVASHSGTGKKAAMFAFVISCPIPVAVCYVWYRLFSWIDKKLAPVTAETEKTHEQTHAQPSSTRSPSSSTLKPIR
jgi:H+/gluconate symporter-like permease